MKKHILYFTVLLFPLTLFGQMHAVTEKGEEVILHADGRWTYKNQQTSWTTRLDTQIFVVPAGSGFGLKGNKLNYTIKLNPKKWKFKKEDDPEGPSEYLFTLIGQDAYGMIIPERIQVPMQELKEVALQNAVKVAPDAHFVAEEIRKVNGTILTFLQIEGTIKGIKFTYLGYYYSSEKGSVQFLTYTSQNLLPQYRQDMEKLLNGLILQD